MANGERAFLQPRPAVSCNVAGQGVIPSHSRENTFYNAHWLARRMEGRVAKERQQEHQRFVCLRKVQTALRRRADTMLLSQQVMQIAKHW